MASQVRGKKDLKVLTDRFCSQGNLSKRESQVFALLVDQVVSAEDIAGALGISKNTVRIHLQNIFQKLSCSSKAEALGKFIAFIAGGVEERSRSMPLDTPVPL